MEMCEPDNNPTFSPQTSPYDYPRIRFVLEEIQRVSGGEDIERVSREGEGGGERERRERRDRQIFERRDRQIFEERI